RSMRNCPALYFRSLPWSTLRSSAMISRANLSRLGGPKRKLSHPTGGPPSRRASIATVTESRIMVETLERALLAGQLTGRNRRRIDVFELPAVLLCEAAEEIAFVLVGAGLELDDVDDRAAVGFLDLFQLLRTDDRIVSVGEEENHVGGHAEGHLE